MNLHTIIIILLYESSIMCMDSNSIKLVFVRSFRHIIILAIIVPSIKVSAQFRDVLEGRNLK